MQIEPRKESAVFTLRIDDSGRLVVPAETRIRQAARAGEQLVGIEEPDGSFKVQKYSDVLREVQDYFAQFKIPGESWADEIVAERRKEAARE